MLAEATVRDAVLCARAGVVEAQQAYRVHCARRGKPMHVVQAEDNSAQCSRWLYGVVAAAVAAVLLLGFYRIGCSKSLSWKMQWDTHRVGRAAVTVPEAV